LEEVGIDGGKYQMDLKAVWFLGMDEVHLVHRGWSGGQFE